MCMYIYIYICVCGSPFSHSAEPLPTYFPLVAAPSCRSPFAWLLFQRATPTWTRTARCYNASSWVIFRLDSHIKTCPNHRTNPNKATIKM